MKRRTLLTAAALALTGCLGGSGDEASTDGTATPAEPTGEPSATRGATTTAATRTSTARTEPRPGTEPKPTGTAAPTATERTDRGTETTAGTDTTGVAGVTSQSFSVESTSASPGNEASVRFADGGSRVVVTGTITGSDGCQTAVLDGITMTDSGLEATVATETDADAGAACSQALVGIEYRLSMTLETPPESVTVVHRDASGRTAVTTAERGG
ncbi:hypothetical protein [Halococcus sediminicola]|uniref:hypothetical protein n=1 Tax=Halococcus sediminicola TaxID=1264579 RepID=UPI000678FD5D|nr:hypothetical protein [Halococcus sediminicola]